MSNCTRRYPIASSLLLVELSLYRVVQEALTNVVKHAPGAAARVQVTIFDDEVRAEIVNGPGASEEKTLAAPTPGLGIMGMRERVGAFGGSLVTQSCPGGGFLVVATIPIEGTS